jgi:hypothetical protein
VMILPTGANKATGLAAALQELVFQGFIFNRLPAAFDKFLSSVNNLRGTFPRSTNESFR